MVSSCQSIGVSHRLRAGTESSLSGEGEHFPSACLTGLAEELVLPLMLKLRGQLTSTS